MFVTSYVDQLHTILHYIINADTLPRVQMETFGSGYPEYSHGSRPHSRAESQLSNAAPPDYNSLNLRGGVYSNRLSGDYRDYSGSLHRNKPMTNPYHLNHYRNSPSDHIPRSHERPPFKTYNSQPRSIKTLPTGDFYDRGSPGLHNVSQGSIDPSDNYDKVTESQTAGSQGLSHQRKYSPGIPPLLTSSIANRSLSMDRTRPGQWTLGINCG